MQSRQKKTTIPAFLLILPTLICRAYTKLLCHFKYALLKSAACPLQLGQIKKKRFAYLPYLFQEWLRNHSYFFPWPYQFKKNILIRLQLTQDQSPAFHTPRHGLTLHDLEVWGLLCPLQWDSIRGTWLPCWYIIHCTVRLVCPPPHDLEHVCQLPGYQL